MRIFSIFLLAISFSSSAADPSHPGLLPMPQEIEWLDGAIEISGIAVNYPSQTLDSDIARFLRDELNDLLDFYHISSDPSITLNLSIDHVEVPDYWEGQEREAYGLRVSESTIDIVANTETGLLYGIQTLRQLIVREDNQTTIAKVNIRDYPAFKIRGFMHDVGRNYQTIEQLKMQIDIMARYKLNVFHWHLTDHFGWRLESKIYPELQEKKAFGRHEGKFYTQEEFKELVNYCWERGMIIIPEFDSPGHSDAFRHGLDIPNMKDPRAKEAITRLIDEVATLAPKEKMPYIHIGTDEVRNGVEKVNADYLPALHEAVYRNDREVIGWWKGMILKDDKRQIQQTWAQATPVEGMRHIDSRSNYVNHMEAMDFASRMLFQQPCRVPYGDNQNLGGILAYWPDNLVEDEKLSLTNNPVIPAMVGYSEAVWTGVKENLPAYWSKIPDASSEEFELYVDFENRIAEQRDRFLTDVPFPMIRTSQLEWQLLGPVSSGEIPELEQGIVNEEYLVNGKTYQWSDPVQGGAIHIKHFFGFESHLKEFPKGKDVVWASTYVWSDLDQTVDAWINFNTTSSSDNRAGVAESRNWNANPLCDIWINDLRVTPPDWINLGNMGKEVAFTDEVYSSRPPTEITLQKGWNKVLVRTAPSWKWVFSFAPIEWDGKNPKEIPELIFSVNRKR